MKAKYDPRIDRFERELRHFDFISRPGMSIEDCKKSRMLLALRDACKDCEMCRLGMQEHSHNGNKIEDPHVFSNLKVSRFMVVGQNPGYNECIEDEPFVGDAGKNFNRELEVNGLTRDDFYISNIVKCHTEKNRAPLEDEKETCSMFLKMEIKILRPLFVVTLGVAPFSILCPKENYGSSLGKIMKSEWYGIKVFPVYHPSPRNLSNPDRRNKFKVNIKTLCNLVKHFKNEQ